MLERSEFICYNFATVEIAWLFVGKEPG